MNKQLNLFSQEQLDEMIVRKHNYKMVRYIGKDGLVPDFYLPDHKIRLIEIKECFIKMRI